MKATFLSLLLLVALVAGAHALDLVTPSGTFKDVKVTKVEAEAIRIAHSEGIALVDFDELPPAMQLEYGWTPEKSAARKAAKEAEAKRIEEEERMIDEAPKRKAAEELAKKRAEEEKEAAAARAVRAADEAKRRAADPEEQKDLVAEAAKARAEIDRERARAKLKPGEVLPDEAPSAIPVATIDPPAPKKNVVQLPFGTVSSLLEEKSAGGKLRDIWTTYPKSTIGVGVAAVVVIILFLLPSGGKKRLPRR
jgi:archaellum component FlaD/FlaE